MHDSVYCIIVLYNAMRWIEKVLLSLRESKYPLSIVCVDNCSHDGTCCFIEDNFPEVYLIKNSENKGFGQANNQGIEYSFNKGAKHYFLLNQDAWIQPDTIQKLVEIQNTYKLGLVSPIHLNGKGSLLDNNFFDALIVRPRNNLFFHDTLLHTLQPYYTTEVTVCAAAWLLSRECIEKVGGFDPLFFHYGEDGNYFNRALFHKIGIGVVPSAYIYHDRVVHGNIEVYNSKKTEIKLLGIYSNVNLPLNRFSIDRFRLHTFFFKVLFRELCHFHLKNIWQIIKGYFGFLFKFKQLVWGRKVNKRVGATWLNNIGRVEF